MANDGTENVNSLFANEYLNHLQLPMSTGEDQNGEKYLSLTLIIPSFPPCQCERDWRSNS
jgi:hypothetical protein